MKPKDDNTAVTKNSPGVAAEDSDLVDDGGDERTTLPAMITRSSCGCLNVRDRGSYTCFCYCIIAIVCKLGSFYLISV